MNKVYANFTKKPFTTTSECTINELVDVIDPVDGSWVHARVVDIDNGVATLAVVYGDSDSA